MRTPRLFFLPVLALGAALAHADVAFSTFGPGDSYFPSTGYTISSSSSVIGTEYYQAMQFQSATTGSLSSVSFAAFPASGSGQVTVGLYADDGADDVASLLGSWTTTVSNPSGNPQVYSIAATGPSLTAGTKYWLGMRALDDTWLGWNLSDPAVYGQLALNYDTTTGSSYQQLAAFRVETRAVPEPASMAALGLGALGILKRRKRA